MITAYVKYWDVGGLEDLHYRFYGKYRVLRSVAELLCGPGSWHLRTNSVPFVLVRLLAPAPGPPFHPPRRISELPHLLLALSFLEGLREPTARRS